MLKRRTNVYFLLFWGYCTIETTGKIRVTIYATNYKVPDAVLDNYMWVRLNYQMTPEMLSAQ